MKFIPTAAALPASALLLANHEDVLAQAAQVQAASAVVLQFPKWTDGRAYSQAVLLRSRLGYRGEIRAQGEVLADMLPMLQRCGFSAVQLRADQRLDVAERALAYFDQHYQQVPPERQAATPVRHAAPAATVQRAPLRSTAPELTAA